MSLSLSLSLYLSLSFGQFHFEQPYRYHGLPIQVANMFDAFGIRYGVFCIFNGVFGILDGVLKIGYWGAVRPWAALPPPWHRPPREVSHDPVSSGRTSFSHSLAERQSPPLAPPSERFSKDAAIFQFHLLFMDSLCNWETLNNREPLKRQ